MPVQNTQAYGCG